VFATIIRVETGAVFEIGRGCNHAMYSASNKMADLQILQIVKSTMIELCRRLNWQWIMLSSASGLVMKRAMF
jgi:hypothetical protein